jgi:hypothetical protein
VFVDKNERGESTNLQGKYGAIPVFNYDEIMSGESDG